MAARWAGWGAGPAGAGATGGPGRLFLAVALLGSAIVAYALWRDGKRVEAIVAGVAALYFALRVLGVLGRRREGP